MQSRLFIGSPSQTWTSDPFTSGRVRANVKPARSFRLHGADASSPGHARFCRAGRMAGRDTDVNRVWPAPPAKANGIAAPRWQVGSTEEGPAKPHHGTYHGTCSAQTAADRLPANPWRHRAAFGRPSQGASDMSGVAPLPSRGLPVRVHERPDARPQALAAFGRQAAALAAGRRIPEMRENTEVLQEQPAMARPTRP